MGQNGIIYKHKPLQPLDLYVKKLTMNCELSKVQHFQSMIKGGSKDEKNYGFGT